MICFYIIRKKKPFLKLKLYLWLFLDKTTYWAVSVKVKFRSQKMGSLKGSFYEEKLKNCPQNDSVYEFLWNNQFRKWRKSLFDFYYYSSYRCSKLVVIMNRKTLFDLWPKVTVFVVSWWYSALYNRDTKYDLCHPNSVLLRHFVRCHFTGGEFNKFRLRYHIRVYYFSPLSNLGAFPRKSCETEIDFDIKLSEF